MNTNRTKQQLLGQIMADMVSEGICADLAKNATNIVPGEGSPDASIVFVGEAPGKQEDLTGKPFVGASGKVLEELLEGIGLKRKDVFITSVLKYRPPKNRDPFAPEKIASMPFLLRQLRVIKPKLVVTLGRHSTECFLPGADISKVHGILFAGGEWPVVPMYHPAAALYNNKLRAILKHDFALLQKIVEGNYESKSE